MKRKPSLLLCSLALALSACGLNGPALQPPQPNPMTGRKFLTLGAVQSPVLDALRQQSGNTFTPYANQDLANYDVLVFDGDAYSPQSLETEPMVLKALAAGKFVLALDITEAHKKDALKKHLLSGSDGPSNVYMMARGRVGEHTAFYIFDDKSGSVAENLGASSLLSGAEVRAQAVSTARQLLSALSSDPFARAMGLRAQDTDSPSSDVNTVPLAPPNANAYLNIYVLAQSLNMRDTYTSDAYPKPIPQTASSSVVYGYWVVTSYESSRRFQFVAMNINGSFDPGTAAYSTSNSYFSPNVSYKSGWFQDYASISVKALSNQLVRQDYSPQVANKQNSVTTSVGFTVGLKAVAKASPEVGGSASFDYKTSYTRTIPDWEVGFTGNEGVNTWRYSSNSPINGTVSGITAYPPVQGEKGLPIAKCPNGFVTKAFVLTGIVCVPNKLNGLNTGSLSALPQIYWQTDTQNPTGDNVIDGDLNFALSSQQGMSLLYAEGYKGLVYRQGATNTAQSTLSMDLGAALPRVVASVKLASGEAIMKDNVIRVKGGSTLEGLLTLAKPVKVRTHIYPVLTSAQTDKILVTASPNDLVLDVGVAGTPDQAVPFKLLTTQVNKATSATLTFVYGEFADVYEIQLEP